MATDKPLLALKVITDPASLTPNALYLKRSGAGFDLSATTSDDFGAAIEIPLNQYQPEQAEKVAASTVLAYDQAALANAGQVGLNVLAVGYTDTGKVQGVSLGDGNVVEVYASGDDYSTSNVLYREFMGMGEPICFTGLSSGAIITSTQGFYGCSEQVNGGNVSPMPLLTYGLAFKKTFFYAFRDSQTYNPDDTNTQNQGWVHIVNGALPSVIKMTFGDGSVVQGQENIALEPWQYKRLYTDGNVEYIIESTNPVMACVNADMAESGKGKYYDSRLIMPLTNDGLTWNANGFLSALYDNTRVNYYGREGNTGQLNAPNGASPGSPIDIDAATPVGMGSGVPSYRPEGAVRFKAAGLISAYSGADGAGLEATPMIPVSALSQVVAQPFYIPDSSDGRRSGVSIQSPYVGTAKVYEWDDTTKSLDLAYTVPLNRGDSVVVDSRDKQNIPAAGLLANDVVTGQTELVGQLNAGIIIADVPIAVVAQADTWLDVNLRSQKGETTRTININEDETLMLGITPETIKTEVREDANGLLRVRQIDDNGGETWRLA